MIVTSHKCRNKWVHPRCRGSFNSARLSGRMRINNVQKQFIPSINTIINIFREIEESLQRHLLKVGNERLFVVVLKRTKFNCLWRNSRHSRFQHAANKWMITETRIDNSNFSYFLRCICKYKIDKRICKFSDTCWWIYSLSEIGKFSKSQEITFQWKICISAGRWEINIKIAENFVVIRVNRWKWIIKII